MKQVIATTAAPQAIGPYSQGIKAGNWVYSSGQLGLSPSTGQLVGETAAQQAEQALQNLAAVLTAGGATMADVVKTTVFLVDLADFAAVNEVYARHFPAPAPARSCVQVAALPKGGRVEIEAMARVE